MPNSECFETAWLANSLRLRSGIFEHRT